MIEQHFYWLLSAGIMTKDDIAQRTVSHKCAATFLVCIGLCAELGSLS